MATAMAMAQWKWEMVHLVTYVFGKGDKSEYNYRYFSVTLLDMTLLSLSADVRPVN